MGISLYKYKKIAKECDRLLYKAGDYSHIVAISNLHVIRSSSIGTVCGVIYNNRYMHDILRHSKSFLFFLFIFFKSIFFRKEYFKKDNIDYLFISHYTGKNNCMRNDVDSYFGKIVSQIQDREGACFVAYINHTNEKHNDISIGCDSQNSIILKKYTSFSQLASIYKGIFLAFFHLRKIKFLTHKEVNNCARENIFYPSTVNNLILAKNVKELVRKLSPKCVVTTYEGHAWERLVFYESKKVDKNIKCVAYQHAPVFKYQHAIKRSIGKKYDPDIILTSGSVSKRQLETSENMADIKIHVLGSSRYIGINEEIGRNSRKENVCLVTPESNMQDCHLLFGFALRCAPMYKNISFIFRFPPMININMLIDYDKKYTNLPDNITVSKNELSDDFSKSYSILYRGSSVAVNGAACGLRPIYLKIKDELTIDPLYEVKDGREIISNTKEFRHSMSKKIDEYVRQDLIRYCKEMYAPLDINALNTISAYGN